MITNSDKKRAAMAWVMWGIMILTYMFNTFHAVAMGVIRQELIDQFLLSENQFVLLTNMFSYTYMVMQIPAGILLDRFGAKKIAVIGAFTAALGTLIFSSGAGYPTLLLGRAVVGLGCSVSFLSVLKISSCWFEEKIFCTMSGVTCFVGMMGAMAAQAPMALLGSIFSWQSIYRGLGVLIFAVAVLVLLIVKDTPQMMGFSPVAEEKEVTDVPLIQAVKSVLKNRWTWPPFISYGCFYGTYLIISGLYGSSILQAFYGCGTVKASSVITFAVIGCAVGSIVVDVAADRMQERKRPQLICGILYLAVWILLFLMAGKGSLTLMYPLIFAIGFFSTAYAVCWSAVKECNHPDYVGISTSIANMGGYLGSIIVPTIAGWIYSGSISFGEQTAYRYVLLGAILMTGIGIAASCFLKETHGRNVGL